MNGTFYVLALLYGELYVRLINIYFTLEYDEQQNANKFLFNENVRFWKDGNFVLSYKYPECDQKKRREINEPFLQNKYMYMYNI